MSIINIREAHREGARMLIGLTGAQGSGKTYSAIMFGYGLAGKNAKKLGFLDTENRRGSLYSDILPNGERFLIGDLLPPFSPERYRSAIKEFQDAGVEVLIIDSVSHEWEGEGGCSDIAEAFKSKKGQPNWIRGKAEHKRFMNTLLYSDMHIVACVRAREKVRVAMVDRELTYISQGDQPIQEKNFWFEVTVGMMLSEAGRKREYLKQLPPELIPFLGKTEGYLTTEDGLALRNWIDGGGKTDPEVEQARNILQLSSEGGLESVKKAWEATPQKIRVILGKPFLETIKQAAIEYDRLRLEVSEEEKKEEEADEPEINIGDEI